MFFCLLFYSYYSSIRYRCTLTKALGCACKGNHVYWTNSISHNTVILPSEDLWCMKQMNGWWWWWWWVNFWFFIKIWLYTVKLNFTVFNSAFSNTIFRLNPWEVLDVKHKTCKTQLPYFPFLLCIFCGELLKVNHHCHAWTTGIQKKRPP